ncbi:MAG: hypothetical protein ACRC57_09365 [Sarcina sp.]
MKNKVKKAYVSISIISFLSLITIAAVAILESEIYRKNMADITTIVDNDKIKFQDDAYNILKEFKMNLETDIILDDIEIINNENKLLGEIEEAQEFEILEGINEDVVLKNKVNEKIKKGYKNSRGRIVYNKNNNDEYVFVYIKAKSGTEMVFIYKYNIEILNSSPSIKFIQL